MSKLPLILENKRTQYARVIPYTREQLYNFEYLQAENERAIAEFLKPYSTLEANPYKSPAPFATVIA